MATVIRLKRGGRKKAPYYRIVVTDSRKRATGRVLEEIGIYHPCASPAPRTEITASRALDWMYKGAKPTDTVRNLLSKQGILTMFDERRSVEEALKAEEAAKAADAPEAATPAAPQAAPAPAVKEAPVAEAPAAEAPAAEAPAAEAPAPEAEAADAPEADAPEAEKEVTP